MVCFLSATRQQTFLWLPFTVSNGGGKKEIGLPRGQTALVSVITYLVATTYDLNCAKTLTLFLRDQAGLKRKTHQPRNIINL
jgi:hypothetical protein